MSDHARVNTDRLDFLDLASQLTAEDVAVRDSVARFVDDRVQPVIRECFERHRFPRELIPQLAALGVFGAQLEGYGCAALSAVACGLIAQELERGDSAIRSFYSVQSALCMFPIHQYGSEPQRQRWLPAMARGEAIGCFGLTESQGGSDPANLQTHARRNGGDWLLSGSKMWITNGSIADVAIIWARTEDGIRGFLVERGMPGFTATEIENKFSLRASVTAGLFLDSVRVPDANLLPGCIGLKGPLSCLTQARYGICWGVIGAAQACLAQLLDYTATRELFGRVLAQNQAVQVRLCRHEPANQRRPVDGPATGPAEGRWHAVAGPGLHGQVEQLPHGAGRGARLPGFAWRGRNQRGVRADQAHAEPGKRHYL